jgi:hypothetical protein
MSTMLRTLLGLAFALMAVPAVATSVNDSPQDLLRELYRVHDQGSGPLLDPKGTLERQIFFTKTLAEALDRELNRSDSEEVGNLDFDPFYNAQDTEIGDFDIAVAKVSGTRTVALVHFLNFGDPMEISYQLTQDEQGWRIDDIVYGEGQSLRTILSGE